MQEVAYEDLEFEPGGEIHHKRILNQIIDGEVEPNQDPMVQNAIAKAIKEFNFCVSNDHLSPERAAEEHGAGEFDHLFDRGEESSCCDHASQLAFNILKMSQK